MIMLLILAAAAHECYPVKHGRILGSDLAAASAVFAAVPPDLVVGNAPLPGSRRLFEPAQLIAQVLFRSRETRPHSRKRPRRRVCRLCGRAAGPGGRERAAPRVTAPLRTRRTDPDCTRESSGSSRFDVAVL